jgi:FkbM family methyltransferase
MRDVTNLVHVGANVGQEAATYGRYGFGVLWVEPIPDVYARLLETIRPYPLQRAHRGLAAEGTGKPYTLHVANNNGASSSVFDFAEHAVLWPTVQYESAIELESESLDDILAKDGRPFNALVMDTQGSELLVLRGARRTLPGFRYILTEAADFNAYEGGTTRAELEQFLGTHGFRLVRAACFAEKPDGSGRYFDLLFEHA